MSPREQLGPADVVCVPMTAEDWPQVEAIYRAGIDTGHATFEAAPPTWEAFDASRSPDHRLVALQGGEPRDGAVLGWAAVSPVSTREVKPGSSSTRSTSPPTLKAGASAGSCSTSW